MLSATDSRGWEILEPVLHVCGQNNRPGTAAASVGVSVCATDPGRFRMLERVMAMAIPRIIVSSDTGGGGGDGDGDESCGLSKVRRTNAISKVLSLIDEQRLLMRLQPARPPGPPSNRAAAAAANSSTTLAEEEGRLARAITVALTSVRQDLGQHAHAHDADHNPDARSEHEADRHGHARACIVALQTGLRILQSCTPGLVGLRGDDLTLNQVWPG